jgi:hypothetical protein
MITAVKVAVQARSEGFLVLHHVLGLAAARSEYNAGLAKTARHLQVLPRG